MWAKSENIQRKLNKQGNTGKVFNQTLSKTLCMSINVERLINVNVNMFDQNISDVNKTLFNSVL